MLIKKMTRDSFVRDILVLLIVSILIGSSMATGVSMAANAYFSKTVANLVGDYGEYDLIIQVREEMKDDAAVHLQKIISEVFPAAKLKEGPTITGKSAFFIALPEEYKTKQLYESLGKTFGSIPGGAGVGVMTEPRLTIRGVPEGAKNMVMEHIMQMEGVRFAFRDGASVGVVLLSIDNASAVSTQIKNLLKEYQVIEISFPVGSEPSNPIRLGEAIANEMQSRLRLQYAQNVSIDGKSDDMTYLVSTMMELKRFLSAYASQVSIVTDGGGKLAQGDTVIFQGAAVNQLTAGNAVEKGNVLVNVTEVRTDGVAEGIITQGDAAYLTNLQGYKLDKNVVGEYVGMAAYRNPRQEFGNALTETSKIVGQIPGFGQDAQNLSTIAFGALDNYGSSINVMEKTLLAVQSAGVTIQSATANLAKIDTGAVQYQLDSSSKAMGGLINTLQVFKLVNPDAGATISSLTSSQQNLDSLKTTLKTLDNVANDARQAKGAIDNIVANGNSTLSVLRGFDVSGARSSLSDANARLAQLQQINVPLVTTQLQYLAASVPNLKDEDISHSVNLLDKFISGQAIPGERIQILTTSDISVDAVAPVVYQQAGHNNVSLYSTTLGVIEPNPRGELYQVLKEVKAVLAGMTAMIATIMFLVFDHTSIMAAIRRKRLENQTKAVGWRNRLLRWATAFFAPERRYGMLAGAVLLVAIFLASGGGIPYLPWIGVPLLGAMLGLVVACYAEKISPVSREEVMAGESLGMSFDEIIREIIIPAGRPGLLQKLNRRKMKFR